MHLFLLTEAKPLLARKLIAAIILPIFHYPEILFSMRLIFLIWYLLPLSLLGQVHGPGFRHLGIPEGLSQGEVEAMCRDHLGLMWIGTRDGLNVWDGYSCRQYRYEVGDSSGLPDRAVWEVAEDPWGDMWIATNQGLSRLSRATQRFTHFDHTPANASGTGVRAVISLLWAADSSLWIGAYDGIYRLSDYHPALPQDSLSFRFESPPTPAGVPAFATGMQLREDAQGIIWCSLTRGLLWIDPRDGSRRWLHPLLDLPPLTQHNLAVSTAETPDGSIWVSLNGAGLLRLRREPCQRDSCNGPRKTRLRSQRYQHDPADPNSLSTNMCTYLTVDQQGRLWVGSALGLHLYRPETDDFSRIKAITGDPEALRDNSIYGLYTDHEGTIWVGTREGISYHSPHNYPFRRLYEVPGSEQGLPSPHVESVLIDAEGQYWIATTTALSRWQPQTNKYQHYPVGTAAASAAAGIIRRMHQTAAGQYWLVSDHAFSRWDPEREQMTHYRLRPDVLRELGTRQLYDILPDGQGRFLLGSHGGILRFDPRTERFEEFPHESNWLAHDLHRDRSGRVWVLGGRRLFWFDESTGAFQAFKGWGNDTAKLHLNLVVDMHETPDGRLWLASERGLVEIRPQAEQVRMVSEHSAFPSGRIRSIEEDGQGRLWVSSNDGLFALDPDTYDFLHYQATDGLHSNQFYSRCSAVGPDGMMIFGGADGCTIFHPDSLRPSDLSARTVITGLSIFNQPYHFHDSSSVLREDIQVAEAVFLEYQQQVWGVTFASTDLTSPETNVYRYRLLGFDDQWIPAPTWREALFTNLHEGHYVLEVMGSNHHGQWTAAPARLTIHIAAPWYRSWWAYTIYAILLVALLGWAIRARSAAIRRQERTLALVQQAKLEERERTRARSSRDFHDEAGNRLTKISLYTGLLRRQLPVEGQVGEFLQHIESHTQALASGMRDFIWVLDPQQDLLSDTLERIRGFGEQLFADTDIAFTYTADLPQNWLQQPLDINSKRHLLMIAKEGMHNALKYSRASQVRLRIFVPANTSTLNLELQDDGLGFEMDELLRVNGLHHMHTRAEEMEAQLRIHSVPGVGTTILLRKEFHPNG